MGVNNLTKNLILTPFNILYKISPETTLKLLFYMKQGYPLNLQEPQTYNEKIQWIKLYDRNPLMPKCCDKFTVRKYAADRGCGAILNTLIWDGYDPRDIPFDSLPDKFVIKVTHGSTFNILCRDKTKLNREKAVRKCRKWLKAKFLPCYGEWFYGKVKPRVIIEKYLEDAQSGHKDLLDYKIYCFNGHPRYIRVMSDRYSNLRDTIYDTDWNLLKDCNMGYPCTNKAERKPDCLKEMLDYAEKLSKDFKHARVDFYIVNGDIVFGEITFSSGAGFDKFSSYEFDLEMGRQLDLKQRTLK